MENSNLEHNCCKFIVSVLKKEVFTIKEITEIFDFKVHFVMNNIAKQENVKFNKLNLDFKREIRRLIKVPGVIEIELDSYKYKVTEHDKKRILEKLKSKVFISKTSLVNLIYNNFKLSFENDLQDLSYEGAANVLNEKWQSFNQLKIKLNLDYDTQIFRILNNKKYGYVKLVYVPDECEGKKPYTSRYARLLK